MLSGQVVDSVRAVQGIRDASYIALVAFVVLLYDHILTFNVEWESFWTLSLTWLRALFFLNRYLSIILAACQAFTASVIYGTFLIITFSSIVQFTRVYILYKRQLWLTRAFTVLMFFFWGCTLGFFIVAQRSLLFRDDWLPTENGCPGCRPVRGRGTVWKPFVPLLIQQTILAGMILFKRFTSPVKGEAAKGVMGVLVRDGTIMYLAILLALVLCFMGATVPALGIPLSAANILLPVFAICTTRLLVNLRAGPHPSKHNDIFAGVEMTGLYLGGYLGGIAPARGVEGAVVTEIGNTTIIEVPVVDLVDNNTIRGGASRCGDRAAAGEDGGNGRAMSDCHSYRGTSVLTMSPPLKVSALGATPGWERWDHRIPTKDLKLPSASPPPDSSLYFDEIEEERIEHHNPPQDREMRHQQVQYQLPSGRRRTSEIGGSARSNTTFASVLAAAGATPVAPEGGEGIRPGTSGTERTLVRKGSYYSAWPSDDPKGGGASQPQSPS